MGLFTKHPLDIVKLKTKNDVKGLIKALQNGDNKVQQEAANALGDLKNQTSIVPLIQALRRIYHMPILQT